MSEQRRAYHDVTFDTQPEIAARRLRTAGCEAVRPRSWHARTPRGKGGSTTQVNIDRHEPPEQYANPPRTSHRASTPVTDRPVRRTGEGGQRQGHDFVRAVTKRAMPEGNRVSRISVRGFAVASATAVTTVGAVVGVASGSTAQPSNEAGAAVGDATLLADIPAGQQAQVQTASLTQQAQTQAIAADTAAQKTAEETARKQAAEDAIAKQKDAQAAKEKAEQAAKDAKKREEAEKVASRSATRDASAFSVQ